MATPAARVTSQVDADLQYLWMAWRSVDQEIEIWSQMEPIDREVFHLEWTGIVEGRLKRLQAHAEELTPDQRRQYDRLLALVAQKRSLLETMLAT